MFEMRMEGTKHFGF